MTRFGQVMLTAALLAGAPMAFAEDVTVTTYYPSPRGVYKELRVTNNGAGTALYIQQTGAGPAFQVDDAVPDTSPFIISQTGSVGIGTAAPGGAPLYAPAGVIKLDVAGGHIRIASGQAGANAFVGRPFLELDHPGGGAPIDLGGGIVWQRAGVGRMELIYSNVDDGLIVWDDVTGAPSGTPRVMFKRTGSVGIGTTTPSAQLDIVGTGDTTVDLHVNGRIQTGDANNHGGIWLGSDNSGFVGENGGNIGFWTNGAGVGWNALQVNKASGNVGIGTTAPGEKLTINNGKLSLTGSVPTTQGPAQSILFGSAGNYYISRVDPGGASDRIQLGANDSNIPTARNILVLHRNGNVGIGTATPGAKLHISSEDGVVGNIWFGDLNEDMAYDGGSDSYFPFVHKGVATGSVAFCYVTAGTRLMQIFNDGNVIIGVPLRPGALTVNGSLAVTGAKLFKINHPLDPTHHDLVHASLEGPEAGVYYRGAGQLVKGHATVQLPNYFEALTRQEERTVLLTPTFEAEEPVSMLAASAVTNGQFTVRAIDGRNPSQTFSWEVQAVRADIDRLAVEVPKSPEGQQTAGQPPAAGSAAPAERREGAVKVGSP